MVRDRSTEQLKVVAVAKNWAESALIKGVLQEAGIECLESGDDASGWRPELTFSRGVRILCFESDEAEALGVLKNLQSGEPNERHNTE